MSCSYCVCSMMTKLFCQKCGNPVEFDLDEFTHAGVSVTSCPHCSASIRLFEVQAPPLLPVGTPPLIKTTTQPGLPQGLECPYCHAKSGFIPRKEFTTGQWIQFFAAIWLTFLVIGIVWIIILFRTREQQYQCSNCRKIF